jgi:hypothetical protein
LPPGRLPLVCLFFLAALRLFPEPAAGFRLLPGTGIPLASRRFDGPGFGLGAAVDWLPLPWFGLSLGGEFTTLTVKNGDGVTMFEGGLGPLFQRRFGDRVTLRAEANAGVYQYQWAGSSDVRMRFTGALSGLFHLSPYVSLVALGGYGYYVSARGDLLQSLKAGAGISLNLMEIFGSRARIRGEKTEQRPVFPVSYAWYEHNPVGTVKITNEEPNAITAVEVSLFLERYMNEPALCARIPRLLPGESAETGMTAFFNESMLDLTENITGNARLLVNYRSLGARKEADIPLRIPVYHRNAMNWDDDRRAASFVSVHDPLAVSFARYVESVLAARQGPRFTGPGGNAGIPLNVQYALGLFGALDVYGVKYLIDPASSYASLSLDASGLDTLNYPYQTLLYRGGDCDDLSILFCSLLEVLKIETAFITTPGHIYMAFDTGLSPEAAAGYAAGGGDLIYRDGRVWMPLEITIPADGFYLAWKIGADEWKKAGEEARLYPTRDSWKIYPPVSVPGAARRRIVMPDEAAVLGAFDAEMGKMTR